jgi:hypothetical protein
MAPAGPRLRVVLRDYRPPSAECHVLPAEPLPLDGDDDGGGSKGDAAAAAAAAAVAVVRIRLSIDRSTQKPQ